MLNDAITAHTTDTTAHITADERAKWNAAADGSAVTDISDRVAVLETAYNAEITADDINALVNGTTTGGDDEPTGDEEPTA